MATPRFTIDVLPAEVGPHEGRELDLMLAGKKPMAYFSEFLFADFEWPDAEFDPYVKTGQIVKREFIEYSSYKGAQKEVRFLYFALPSAAGRIEEAHRIRMADLKTRDPVESKKADIAFGRLLGYTEHEINTYLAWSDFRRAEQEKSQAQDAITE